MTQLSTSKQMQDSDKRAISDNEETSRQLMYKAAYGVYNSVSWQDNVGIVVGKGNNGGDGYCLALILKEKGYKVEIISLLGEPSK